MDAQLTDTRHLLSGLRDVAGVVGSAVFSTGGKAMARDLPSYVDSTTLDGAGERLARMSDAFASKSGEQAERMVLRFKEHKLFVQAYAGGVLAIVTASDANMAALKMAANLVTRRLPVFPDVSASAPPPAPEPSEPAIAVEALLEAEEVPIAPAAPEDFHEESARQSRPVYFRGRRVE
jgi:predicted regulator of Ras-like GTPase activity (Roadblock/LC7/MglB family)